MEIRPIRTGVDLTEALREIRRLRGPVGTPEGGKLDVLVTLAGAYKRAQPLAPESDPVEILHFAIGEMGRSQAELAGLLGARSQASMILNRKHPLSLDQIRRIAEGVAAADRRPGETVSPHAGRGLSRAPHRQRINTR
ncbi:helix-turn-helix domain-containing protein [Methylorubrum aminovorans]|uniref:helix-turn-helix domain-containing protein n=1 Tax=Methylorubrum aminovorans TaxID=269069 RepID=UPI003C2C5981